MDKIIKDVRNIFKIKKKNKITKGRIIRDIRSLFEFEEKKTLQTNRGW